MLDRCLVLVDLEAEVRAHQQACAAAGAAGKQLRVGEPELVARRRHRSTRGGQAGMHSSQPLQRSTAIVTVPRLDDARRALMTPPLPVPRRGHDVGFGALEAGAKRLLVRVQVLAPIGRDRVAHGLRPGPRRRRVPSSARRQRPGPSRPRAAPRSPSRWTSPVRRRPQRRRASMEWSKSDASSARRCHRGGASARRGAQNAWCIAMADQASDTIGGEAIGSSPTTRVDAVDPPRMVPP